MASLPGLIFQPSDTWLIIDGHKNDVLVMINIFVATLAFAGSRIESFGERVKIPERFID